MNTKDFFKREWALWIVILAPLIFAIYSWNDFPDKIPMHWNLEGEVDDWGGKWAVFFSPLVNTAIYLLLLVVPRLDPRRKNYQLFSGAYMTIRVCIAVFLSMLGIVTLLYTLGWKINVGLTVIFGVLLLFLVLGNQLGRIRPAYLVGFRTPWTLNNEEVWMRTHRFAGRVWVIGTLVMIAMIWWFPMKVVAVMFICYVSVIVLLPLIYSWKVHKEIVGHQHP